MLLLRNVQKIQNYFTEHIPKEALFLMRFRPIWLARQVQRPERHVQVDLLLIKVLVSFIIIFQNFLNINLNKINITSIKI